MRPEVFNPTRRPTRVSLVTMLQSAFCYCFLVSRMCIDCLVKNRFRVLRFAPHRRVERLEVHIQVRRYVTWPVQICHVAYPRQDVRVVEYTPRMSSTLSAKS